MKTPEYSLLDGEAQNRRHPRTFHVPSILEKHMVEPGDHVKLGFSCPGFDNTERMWVKVTGNGVGYLDNDPAFLPLKYKMVIHFQRQHILDILKPGDL